MRRVTRLIFVCGMVCMMLVFTRDGGADETVESVASLRNTIFELQSQIQGYRNRIGEAEATIRTAGDVLRVLEERKKKLVLEARLVELARAAVVAELRDEEERIREIDTALLGEHRVLGALLQDLARDNEDRLVAMLVGQRLSQILAIPETAGQFQNEVREARRAVRETRQLLEMRRRILEQKDEELKELSRAQHAQGYEADEEAERYRLLSASSRKHATLYTDLVRQLEEKSFSLQQEFFDREGVGKELGLRDALFRANAIATKVGIRGAFLLAVVARESKLGAIQGGGTWRTDMHPSQWSHFLLIMQRLGLNPDTAPVSQKPSYGWGGAMGPLQMLPSTWLTYAQRVSELTGHLSPSPWNIDDAMAGAALKLAEAGADAKTESAERRAALIYFAGGNWNNPAFEFYADDIMELAWTFSMER